MTACLLCTHDGTEHAATGARPCEARYGQLGDSAFLDGALGFLDECGCPAYEPERGEGQ